MNVVSFVVMVTRKLQPRNGRLVSLPRQHCATHHVPRRVRRHPASRGRGTICQVGNVLDSVNNENGCLNVPIQLMSDHIHARLLCVLHCTFLDLPSHIGREQSAEQGGTRRYAQLVADGEEDDSALVDQATVKDREWDSWKEENPRGWGNKMGKRF